MKIDVFCLVGQASTPLQYLKLVSRSMYKYKMVQIPPNIAVQMKEHKGNEAAAYLEAVVNEHASQGWEFYRVDSFGVELQPGCFDALSGKKKENTLYYVITLRQEQ